MSICHISLIIRLNSYYTIQTMSSNIFWNCIHFFMHLHFHENRFLYNFLQVNLNEREAKILAIGWLFVFGLKEIFAKRYHIAFWFNWQNYVSLSSKIVCAFFKMFQRKCKSTSSKKDLNPFCLAFQQWFCCCWLGE